MQDTEEPKGIGFFNVKSGETHHVKMEAQIQAYINSSDMGINASRGQDYGWRLAPEWVKKVKAFRKDEGKMAILTTKADGRKITLVNILYYIYGQQLRVYSDAVEEDSSPHEEKYLQDISNSSTAAKEKADLKAAQDKLDADKKAFESQKTESTPKETTNKK